MRTLLTCVIVGATLLTVRAASPLAPQAAEKPLKADQVVASTYEHLATAIIEIEATEDELVKGILVGYHHVAQDHLKAAVTDAPGRAKHLEEAASEIANIANEGDKRIQAIRQRLAKAGHTHNTDVETKEDYMFITNKEKKGLVALAGKITKLGEASEADLKAAGAELEDFFNKAIAAE